MRTLFLAGCLAGLLAGCASAPTGKAVTDLTTALWREIGVDGHGPPEAHAIQPAEMAALRNSTVVATYYCSGRRMYVRADHATDDDWLSGILVHELTHHKQCIEGRLNSNSSMCPLEVEAYRAQIAWLSKLADSRGFLMGANARNMAGHVQRHMERNFSHCL